MARNLELLPDLRWSLLSWVGSGEVVFLEWQCRATLNGSAVEWRGVDKVTLAGGRISEEIVYCDTLPLWAALEPGMKRGALIDANSLADVDSARS